jgi:predicted enzyme related to lactoylglutathione lyase
MHRVIHFELGAQDPERAVKFYEEVFGWKISKWEGPTPYWLVKTGENSELGINGGIMKYPDAAARTVNTIGVPSVDEFVTKAVAHGAKVALPKMAIPGVGYQAYCTDTEGNLFGIHQTDPNAK